MFPRFRTKSEPDVQQRKATHRLQSLIVIERAMLVALPTSLHGYPTSCDEAPHSWSWVVALSQNRLDKGDISESTDVRLEVSKHPRPALRTL